MSRATIHGSAVPRGPLATLRRHPIATVWGLVVFLLLSSGAFAWAFWSSSQSTVAVEAGAGTYGVTQTGLTTLGSAYSSTTPASTVALQITNTGTLRSAFTYAFTSSDTTAAGAFTSTTWQALKAADCTSSATPPANAVVTATAAPSALSGTLDAGASVFYCVREQLKSTAPAAAFGTTFTLQGSAGIGVGAWAKTTTAAATLRASDDVAPTAVTASLGQVTATSARIDWAGATDNAGIAGYRISRGGVVVGTVAADATSWTDDSLVTAKSYTYTVEAFDAAGNKAVSNTVSATTTAASYFRFVAVTGGRCLAVTGSGTTSGSATSVATCGASTNSQGWGIAPRTDGTVRLFPKHATTMRLGVTSTTAGSRPTILSEAAAVNDRWEVRTNADATVSLYNVSAGLCLAVDSTGANGAAVRLQTCDASLASQKFGYRSWATDRTAPVAPAVSVTDVTGYSARISWSGASDDVAVASYVIKRDGTTVATLGPLESTWTDTSLLGYTTYSYTVTAADAAGNATQSAAATATTTGLARGGSYEVTIAGLCLDVSGASTTSGSVVIGWECHDGANQSWTASVLSDGSYQLSAAHAPTLRLGASASAQGTQLQILTDPGTNARWTQTIVNGTATLMNADTGLCLGLASTANGTAAQLQTCNASTLQTLTLRPLSVDEDIAPSAPSASLSPVAATAITVTWSAATDNAGIAGYRVYRDGTLVATLGRGTFSWVDDSLSPVKTYAYQVEALDVGGNTTKSTSVSATTPAATYSRFVSASDGRCLEVTSGSTSSGATLRMWTCSTSRSYQGWAFAPMNDGSTRLLPQHATTLRMGAASANAGTTITVLSATAAANARWEIRTNGDGTVSLYNLDASLCAAADSSTSNGASVKLRTCDSASSAQKFTQQSF